MTLCSAFLVQAWVRCYGTLLEVGCHTSAKEAECRIPSVGLCVCATACKGDGQGLVIGSTLGPSSRSLPSTMRFLISLLSASLGFERACCALKLLQACLEA